MHGTPVESLGHSRVRRAGVRAATLAFLLSGLVLAAPASAQVAPPMEPATRPLGHLVYASQDGTRVHAYAELYQVSGLVVDWDAAEPAGDGGTRSLRLPPEGVSTRFLVRFTTFQLSNLNRMLFEQTDLRPSWYVVLTDLPVSGGAGTYMYWRLQGLPSKVDVVPADGVTYHRLEVHVTAGQGVNNCTVTRSGASGQCVLPPAALAVVAPRPVLNKPSWVQVTARDVLGQRVRSYLGTVHFTAARQNGAAVNATLPADFTFRARNAGNRVFTGVVFRESGAVQLTVQDTANPSLRGRIGLNVYAPTSGCSRTGC